MSITQNSDFPSPASEVALEELSCNLQRIQEQQPSKREATAAVLLAGLYSRPYTSMKEAPALAIRQADRLLELIKTSEDLKRSIK